MSEQCSLHGLPSLTPDSQGLPNLPSALQVFPMSTLRLKKSSDLNLPPCCHPLSDSYPPLHVQLHDAFCLCSPLPISRLNNYNTLSAALFLSTSRSSPFSSFPPWPDSNLVADGDCLHPLKTSVHLAQCLVWNPCCMLKEFIFKISYDPSCFFSFPVSLLDSHWVAPVDQSSQTVLCRIIQRTWCLRWIPRLCPQIS